MGRPSPTATDLFPAETHNHTAKAINTAGDIVGWIETSSRYKGYVRSAGGAVTYLTPLGGGELQSILPRDINDKGVVVGASSTDQKLHAFRYKNGIVKDLGVVGKQSEANAVSLYGAAVGWADETGDLAGGIKATLWRATGARVSLGAPAGFSSATAMGVNKHLEVVGHGTHSDGRTHGLYWKVTIKTFPLLSVDPDLLFLGSTGLVSATILGARDLDPSMELEPAMLTLGDGQGRETSPARNRAGDVLAQSRDVDGDGLTDLVIQFRQADLEAHGDLTAETKRLYLLGSALGYEVKALDSVRVARR